MRTRIGVSGALALLSVALVLSACSAPLRGVWQMWNAAPPVAGQVSYPTATVAAPTAPPMAGPMGTLTAIAELIASPTPNRTPYQIVSRGRPHFLIFHAWW